MIHIYQLTDAAYPDQIDSKKWMIFGEGLVFLTILVIGIVQIIKSVRKEIQLNRQQSNFLLSVTHELKTPIASLKLLLQTIKNPNLDSDKKNKFVESGLLDIERLNTMIDNLLLTARMENGQHELQFKTIDLEQFVEELVKKYGHIIRQKHQLKLDIESITVQSEETALTSILLNLLENATKYSPADSTITIKAFQKNGSSIIQIIDEGSGIPKEEKELITQKFYRIGNENTRNSKGSGLGLYIVSQLLELNHAQLEILDNQPTGSIFQIVFTKKES